MGLYRCSEAPQWIAISSEGFNFYAARFRLELRFAGGIDGGTTGPEGNS